MASEARSKETRATPRDRNGRGASAAEGRRERIHGATGIGTRNGCEGK